MQSALEFVPPNAGRRIEIMTNRMIVTLSGTASAGRLLVVEQTIPAGAGAPMHAHAEASETFYLLAGSLIFVEHAGRRRAGPGALVHVLPRVEHAFVNPSADTAARMLVIYAPIGQQERFLDLANGVDDPARLAVIGAANGITTSGPPPTVLAGEAS